MLRPTNAGAATSALFEMKKGAAFLVRQDQQNDAQIFMILFWEKYRCQPEKRRWKRALAERICPKREKARFESGQTLWNSDLHLWFERKNPGLKKPGNGWCAWLFTRRIYTVSLICHVLIKKIHSQSIVPQGFAAFLWKFFKNPSLTSEPPTND